MFQLSLKDLRKVPRPGLFEPAKKHRDHILPKRDVHILLKLLLTINPRTKAKIALELVSFAEHLLQVRLVSEVYWQVRLGH